MPLFSEHRAAITGTKFALDGRSVFSSSLDGYIRCWDVDTLSEQRKASRKSKRNGDSSNQLIRHKVSCFTLNHVSEVFFGTFDGGISQWSDGGVALLGSHREPITSLASFKNASKLVSSSLDRTVRLWDIGRPNYVPIRVWEKSEEPYIVNTVACVPGDSILLTASEDGSIRTIDTRSRSVQGKWKAHLKAATCLDICWDGLRIISGSLDTTVIVWDLRVGKPLGDPIWTLKPIRSVAYSPDGTKFAAGTDETLWLWESTLIIPLSNSNKGHRGPVNTVAFSPDGNRFATGGADHNVRVWTVNLLPETADMPAQDNWSSVDSHRPRDLSSFLALETPSAPLGSGGFGEVYVGRWLIEDCLIPPPPVVLKVLHSRYAGHGKREATTRRLNREISLWQRLNPSYPNILPFFGVSKTIGVFPASVSLYLENGTIISYVKRYPKVNRLSLLHGVSRGLKYLHFKSPSIIHGDIKAENILVTNHGIPYITDFGISRVLGEHPFWKTDSKSIKGSIRWMSPELLKESEEGVTAASDVYAFGITCLEILTESLPFAEYKSEASIILQVGLNGVKPSRPKGIPELSDGLWSLLMSCWNSTPRSRPSMRTVSDELTNLSTSFRPLRLLSIVGGPLSAFATLGHLEAISKRSGIKRLCDMFDMVAASGYGRIIAYLLVELRMEIADCAFEFIGLVRSAFEHLSKDGSDKWISASNFLYRRLQEIQSQYKRQIEDSPAGSEPCKMVLIGESRLPSTITCRATNYSKCAYATPKHASPDRGILEALLADIETSPDPSLDLLEEARGVFGSHRYIGCFVRCGQNDGRNRLNREAVKQPARDEFRQLVEGPSYFRFILEDQAIKTSIEEVQHRKNHAKLAMMYRKLALAYMEEDAQRSRLSRLVPRLHFSV